jgi:hypothetical protein
MAKTATRLISKYGDTQQAVTVTTVEGATEFDPPIVSQSSTDIKAVVTGVSKWEVNETVLSTDLKVIVTGEAQVFDIGGIMKIDSSNHTIISRRKVLAAGDPSVVIYFVRQG